MSEKEKSSILSIKRPIPTMDWDLENDMDDEDILLNDDVGDDTFIGLEDFLHQQATNNLQKAQDNNNNNDFYDQKNIENNTNMTIASTSNSTSSYNTMNMITSTSESFLNDNNYNNNDNISSKKVNKDYSRPPTTGSFLTATCPRTGKPIYFACQPQSSKKKTKALMENCYDKNARLLSTPIRLMFEQIKAENEAYTQQLQR